MCSEISAQNWGTMVSRVLSAWCLITGSGSCSSASTPAADDCRLWATMVGGGVKCGQARSRRVRRDARTRPGVMPSTNTSHELDMGRRRFAEERRPADNNHQWPPSRALLASQLALRPLAAHTPSSSTLLRPSGSLSARKSKRTPRVCSSCFHSDHFSDLSFKAPPSSGVASGMPMLYLCYLL